MEKMIVDLQLENPENQEILLLKWLKSGICLSRLTKSLLDIYVKNKLVLSSRVQEKHYRRARSSALVELKCK
jgi:hypothetical protein